MSLLTNPRRWELGLWAIDVDMAIESGDVDSEKAGSARHVAYAYCIPGVAGENGRDGKIHLT